MFHIQLADKTSPLSLYEVLNPSAMESLIDWVQISGAMHLWYRNGIAIILPAQGWLELRFTTETIDPTHMKIEINSEDQASIGQYIGNIFVNATNFLSNLDQTAGS